MALEPTSVQRDRMLKQGKTKLILAQFLEFKDPATAHAYFSKTHKSLLAENGSRGHYLIIDQVITSGNFPYHYLVVDSFPSSQSLLMAHERSREIRQDALTSCYALLVQPNPWLPRITQWLGFLEVSLRGLLNTAETRSFTESSEDLNPDTDPDLEKIREFKSRDPDQPFYMMNLNRYFPKGKNSYNQYSAWIMPYLLSVGGYPDVYGKVLGSYIGDKNDSLFIGWHDFALVYYPSRLSFLRLMTNTPRGAAKIRREGLRKVVLMASSNL